MFAITAKLLVQRVVPVAHGRLRHLRQQRLGVSQQQMLHGAAPVEFVLQRLALQLEGRTGALHDGAAGGGFPAHEERDADNALVSR
ncbi:hypothetical protein G6F22_021615 [Rhizopus arrhizus]|nr:hypothetical protein G6F22_021615 [Rhizopus arrhizus]